MVSTSVVMSVFGGWSYYTTHQQLHQQSAALKTLLIKHLSLPVANALWVYDVSRLNAVLDSEVGNAVQSLEVFDSEGKLVTQRGVLISRDQQGADAAVEAFKIELPAIGKRVLGHIQVSWSNASLQATLKQRLWMTVVEIAGVNMALFVIFWFGIDRIIFRRIAVLQQALDRATHREDVTDFVALPVTLRDEFGAITHSINSITARLGAELESGRESEEEARAALSNLQSAQEGLVQAEKMASLGRLVAGIAHELNTPIGNILMVASTQEEVAKTFEKYLDSGALTRSALATFVGQTNEAAKLLVHSAGRAAELIQNFKQVAVDQSTDQLREFDLAYQTGEVLSVLAHLLAKTPIRMLQHLEPGIRMHSFPGPLGQVVTNLVMNAMKHGFDEGQAGLITVSCRRHEGRACITVTDNGKGIPLEHIGKIFDPFFTTKLGQGGSGLGLNISHNIVYGPLGGRLSVQSEVGVGTTFTLMLPMQVAAA